MAHDLACAPPHQAARGCALLMTGTGVTPSASTPTHGLPSGGLTTGLDPTAIELKVFMPTPICCTGFLIGSWTTYQLRPGYGFKG